MIKAFKYRLYPNQTQKDFLEKSFGCARWVYNWGLEQKIKAYNETGKSPSYYDLQRQLPKLKQEYEWLKEPSATTLQYSLRNLDNAYTNFFKKRAGFPKFRNKHCNNSFQQTQTIGVSESHIKIEKIGNIMAKISREPVGKLKSITISKRPSGKYFASCLYDTLTNIPEKKTVLNAVGIDLGIKDFATLSNGEKIANPKWLRKSTKRLAHLQRLASRKVKGSNNRKCANLKVARLHERITNQRLDYLHNLSTRLVRENQYIALEDLNIKGMSSNHKLARSISECSWSVFMNQLIYKASWYGSTIVKIGRFEASSRTCICGVKNKNLTLADRVWTCESCGITHDRDVLAANNILTFSGWQSPVVAMDGQSDGIRIASPDEVAIPIL